MSQPPTALREAEEVVNAPTCICRTYEASKYPPPPTLFSRVDPKWSTERIFPRPTLQDCPPGVNRQIGEHSTAKTVTDMDGNRYMMYQMYMKEVCTQGRYRKERDLVLGDWVVSEELAECSLYNVLSYMPSNMPWRAAPMSSMDVRRFDVMCSACGKPPGW